MKQVQITVPYEKTESILDFILDVMGIKNVTKLNADNAHLLQFRIPDDAMTETVEKLKSRGLGVEFGFIDMLDLRASLPRASEEEKDVKIQREAALAVEEIYESVKSGSSLSFDFITFVVLAAVIAGIGLLQNNGTVIVASMLLSPLMGPMLAVALGYVVSDRTLCFKGTVNELIALALSFAMGALIGFLCAVFATDMVNGIRVDIDASLAGQYVTEITRRNGFVALDVGVALFSGAAVAVSITRGDMSSLVGVAISASLMPPAVNVGMLLMLALMTGVGNFAIFGIGSLMLLVMNIVVIDIAAIIMFKVKKLSPIKDKSATWTAVTRFRRTGYTGLYHASKPESIATFVPSETRREGEE
ncbi:MAG: TIGR00341 family protein [Candidatus Thorarchaeota archaeon]|nr:TIGR00341 family protein [Candidatus Thorarchaeota archaeon]